MAETGDAGGATPEFRIGFAMAGAISAGAYTAGVVDFMLQALDEWEAGGTAGLAALVDDPAVASERSGYPATPAHRACIASLSGASAGGMTSAILAAAVGGPVTPVTTVPAPDDIANAFYQSWVRRIDLTHLLDDADRKAGGKLVSILDSTELESIAGDAIKVSGPMPNRPYIADPLRVFLTVANLRGVPYRIVTSGQSGDGHGMMMHGDYMEFAVATNSNDSPDSAIWLNPLDYSDGNWQTLAQSALASGAFPGGLAPRRLTRIAGEYGARQWQVPTLDGIAYTSIPPQWSFPDSMEVDFLNVDGGLINNEPLELARRALRREGEPPRNARLGAEASRAVLMIDPFPSPVFDPGRDVDADIVSVAKAMFGALKAEARFKPDELVLATAADVYSRFLIAPTRTPPGAAAPERHAIASGVLGGFGGFLAQSFREHDFNLGRRNCQMFLRRHFLLPMENRLFDRWPDALKQAMRRRHPDDPTGPDDHLPIVPLVGAANEPVPWRDWPSMGEDELGALKKHVKRRAKVVVKALVREHLHKAAATPVWWVVGGRIVKKVMAVIRDSLHNHGLWR